MKTMRKNVRLGGGSILTSPKGNKTRKFITAGLVVVLVALVIGVSYSVYNFAFLGNGNLISTDGVEIEFLESNSDIISISNALPMTVEEGMKQNETFDFVVTTRTRRTMSLPYTLVLEKLDVSEGYIAFEDYQVQIYLTDENDNYIWQGPIDYLYDYILHSKTNFHSSDQSEIKDKYKLRVWLDYDNVDSSDWTEDTKLEYKFKIGVKAEASEYAYYTPDECFEVTSDGEIIDYYCASQVAGPVSLKEVKYKVLPLADTVEDITYPEIFNVRIPEYITNVQGEKVQITSIGERVFKDKGLLGVLLPKNLISIGSYAFSGNKLTSVMIPDSVTSIGASAFSYNKLMKIKLSNNLTSLEDDVFMSNYLSDIDFPDGIVSIGQGAFDYNKFKSVELPNSVVNLNGFANNELTSVYIPNSVISIGDGAFSYNKLASVAIPDGVVSIGNFAFYSNKLTSINLPNSVTSIGNSAFSTNMLTSVTLPNNISTIEYGTFQYNQLSNVVIPDSVENLSGFDGNNLTNIDIPNSVVSIGQNAFSNNKLTNVVMPDNVTSVGSKAFYDNDLVSVTLSNNLVTIDNDAFSDNDLENVILPNSLVSIGQNAFSTNKLMSVVIPNSVTGIGRYAFLNNDLRTVQIGTSTDAAISGFGGYSFYKTSSSNGNLTKIINKTGKALPFQYALFGTNSTSKIVSGRVINVVVTTE